MDEIVGQRSRLKFNDKVTLSLLKVVFSLCIQNYWQWKRLSVDAPSRDVPSLSVFLPHRPSNTDIPHNATAWTANYLKSWCHAVGVTFTPWRHAIDVTWRHVTSWHPGVTSNDILCHDSGSIWAIPSEVSKIHVFQHGDLDLWPMTLIFELVRYIIKVHTSTKFWFRTVNRSAVRALTDTQTGPIPYTRPLTREGKIQRTNK